MKNLLYVILVVALMIPGVSTFAQTNNGINYQAIVRTQAGDVVTNQPVGIRVSVVDPNNQNTILYAENHQLTTNSFGLVNTRIGEGTWVSGNFGNIDWSNSNLVFQLDYVVTDGSITEAFTVNSTVSSTPVAKYANDVSAGALYNHMVNDASIQALFNPVSFQTVTRTGDDITLSDGGGTVSITDNDADATNEIQDLELNQGVLFITKNQAAIGVDLTPYLDNTDAQQVSFSNDIISIENGGTVDLSTYANSIAGNNSSITNIQSAMTLLADSILWNRSFVINLATSLDSVQIYNNWSVSAIDVSLSETVDFVNYGGPMVRKGFIEIGTVNGTPVSYASLITVPVGITLVTPTQLPAIASLANTGVLIEYYYNPTTSSIWITDVKTK